MQLQKQIKEKLEFDLAFYKMTGIKTSFLLRCEALSGMGASGFEEVLNGN